MNFLSYFFNPLRLIFSLIIILLIYAVSSTIKTKKCADKDCSVTISLAKVVLAYTAESPLHLRLKRDEIVNVKSKSGSDFTLWGGEVNNKAGFFPHSHVKVYDEQFKEPLQDVLFEDKSENWLNTPGRARDVYHSVTDKIKSPQKEAMHTQEPQENTSEINDPTEIQEDEEPSLGQRNDVQAMMHSDAESKGAIDIEQYNPYVHGVVDSKIPNMVDEAHVEENHLLSGVKDELQQMLMTHDEAHNVTVLNDAIAMLLNNHRGNEDKDNNERKSEAIFSNNDAIHPTSVELAKSQGTNTVNPSSTDTSEDRALKNLNDSDHGGIVTESGCQDISSAKLSIKHDVKGNPVVTSEQADNGEPAVGDEQAVEGEQTVRVESAVGHEQVIRDLPTVVDEQAVKGVPAVDDEPDVKGEPPVEGKSAVVDEQAVKGKTAVEGEQAVGGESAVGHEQVIRYLPTVVDEQAVKGVPTVDDEPAVVDEQAVKGKTAVEDEKAVRGESTVGHEQVMRGVPTVVDLQAVKSDPSVDDEQAVKDEPAVGDEQVVKGVPTVDDEPSVKGEPAVEGKKAVVDEQAVKGKTAVEGEQAVRGESTVGHEQVMRDVPTVVDKQAVKGKPAVDDEPAVKGEPAVGDEPAVSIEQAVKGEPAVGDEPAVAVEQAVKSGPSVDDEQAVKDEPAVGDEQVVRDEQVVNGKTAVEGEQDVGGESAVGHEQVIRDVPPVVDKQAVKGKPAVDDEPAVKGEPAVGDEPAVAVEQSVKGEPAVGDEPAVAVEQAVKGEPAVGGMQTFRNETAVVDVQAAIGEISIDEQTVKGEHPVKCVPAVGCEHAVSGEHTDNLGHENNVFDSSEFIPQSAQSTIMTKQLDSLAVSIDNIFTTFKPEISMSGGESSTFTVMPSVVTNISPSNTEVEFTYDPSTHSHHLVSKQHEFFAPGGNRQNHHDDYYPSLAKVINTATFIQDGQSKDSSTSETLNVDRQHHRDSYDSLAYVSISPRDDYTGIPTDGVSMPVVHTAVISDAVKDTGELSGVSDDLHAHIGYDSTSYTSDVVSPASTLLSQNVLHSSDQEPTWNEQIPQSIQAVLAKKPLGLSPTLTLFFTIATFSSFIFLTCSSCLSSSRNKPYSLRTPLVVVRDLEEKLFIAVKETENLEDQLQAQHAQMDLLTAELDVFKRKLTTSETKLSETMSHNVTLKDEVQYLSDNISHLKEHLSSTLNDITNKNAKIFELESESERLQDVYIEMEQELKQKEDDEKHLTMTRDELQTLVDDLTEHVNQLDAGKLELLSEVEGWKEKVDDLMDDREQLKQTNMQQEKTISLQYNELEVMKDCYRKLKSFEDNEDVNDGEVATTRDCTYVQEKIKAMMDVSRINAELQAVCREKEGLESSLRLETSSRMELEGQLVLVHREKENHLTDKLKADRQCLEAQTKLSILSSYFKDKEVLLQRELGEHEALKKQNKNKLDSADDESQMLQKELDFCKQQIESLKWELVMAERDFRVQIAANEKKAHENWLSARSAERELKEMRNEAAMLRQKLTETERKYTDTELVRPFPTRGLPSTGLPRSQLPPPPLPLTSISQATFHDGSYQLSQRELDQLPPSHPARHMFHLKPHSSFPPMPPPDFHASPPGSLFANATPFSSFEPMDSVLHLGSHTPPLRMPCSQFSAGLPLQSSFSARMPFPGKQMDSRKESMYETPTYQHQRSSKGECPQKFSHV